MLLAELIADVVDGIDALDDDIRVGDDLAVLDVEAVNALEGASVGAILSDELGHEGEGLGGVDRLGRAVEVLVAQTEAVEVAAI